jgi:hypothetical protein
MSLKCTSLHKNTLVDLIIKKAFKLSFSPLIIVCKLVDFLWLLCQKVSWFLITT